MSDIHADIREGKYKNALPYGDRGSQQRVAHRLNEAYLGGLFRADLLAYLELTGHPKADLLLAKAWEMGHSAGFSEVAIIAEDLAGLLR